MKNQMLNQGKQLFNHSTLEPFYLDVTLFVCCMLSFISCITVFVKYSLLKHKPAAFSLTIRLTFSDFFLCIDTLPYIITYLFFDREFKMKYHQGLCIEEGIMTGFGLYSSYCMTVLIINGIYQLVKTQMIDFQSLKRWTIASFILSFVLAIIPVISDNINPLAPFRKIHCYVRIDGVKDVVGTIYRIMFECLPFWVILIYQIIVICKINKELSILLKLRLQETHVAYLKYLRKLTIMYPLSFCICFLPIILDRTIYTITGLTCNIFDNDLGAKIIPYCFCLSKLTGFINSLVFVYFTLISNNENEEEEEQTVTETSTSNTQNQQSQSSCKKSSPSSIQSCELMIEDKSFKHNYKNHNNNQTQHRLQISMAEQVHTDDGKNQQSYQQEQLIQDCNNSYNNISQQLADPLIKL